MRGTVAKKIRRLIFGEESLRAPRNYLKTKKGSVILVRSKRKLYRDAKRLYKETGLLPDHSGRG